jgi:hypothetical protein
MRHRPSALYYLVHPVIRPTEVLRPYDCVHKNACIHTSLTDSITQGASGEKAPIDGWVPVETGGAIRRLGCTSCAIDKYLVDPGTWMTEVLGSYDCLHKSACIHTSLTDSITQGAFR